MSYFLLISSKNFSFFLIVIQYYLDELYALYLKFMNIMQCNFILIYD